MSSNDRSIDRSHACVFDPRNRSWTRLASSTRAKRAGALHFFCHIFSHSDDTRSRVFIFSLKNPRMPPRRLIPGEGAKYQNAVAYKADLHVKTSESAQKVLASLKNQALQNICKRCREKIECALFCCRCFCRRKYRYTCAYAFRVFGHFVVVVVVVVVGWVSTVSLFSFAISFYLSLSLSLCVCVFLSTSGRDAHISKLTRASHIFSRTQQHTHAGKFKYGKYKHKKSASLLKCQNCEKSTVKLRYRKLCLSCAQESGRCPQCSKSQKEQELEDRAKREVANDGEEREEEEEEEEETTDDEAYEEEGIVITRR